METYKIIRVSGTGRRSKIRTGLNADYARNLANKLKSIRPTGSSTDYLVIAE